MRQQQVAHAFQSEHVTTAWRLRNGMGRIMECTIHCDNQSRISVRIHYGRAEIVRTCRVGNVSKAWKKADEWRRVLLSLSEYQELPSMDGSPHR